MKKATKLLSAALGAGLLFSATTSAQQADPQIRTQDLGNGIYVLFGPGGNIGISVGEDGVLLIDDKFDRLNEKIIAAVAEITDKPIRFLLNTHWHGDHTGGNQKLGEAGAVIVAHDNVYERMSSEQVQKLFNRTVPASPREALPVITFNDEVSFQFNGDRAHVYHAPNAHTDGDSFVYFEKANVIHMGDLYFAGRYPFIDIGSGGTLTGVVAGLDKGLALINDQTQVISGHGGVTSKAELQAYRDVASAVHDVIAKMIADGKTLEEVLEAKVTAPYDEKWGNGFKNLNDPVGFVTLAYKGMTGASD